MDKLQTMSTKELTRLEIIQRIEAKRMSQREASEILGVSERHMRRLISAYRQEGERDLISKRRGRPSNNRLGSGVKDKVRDLIYER